jgi:GNAT superfamily N-acetyltransferase
MPGFLGYVVCLNEKAVGACLGRPSSLADEDVFTIEYMFVDPRHQGKGYGKRLLIHVKEALLQASVSKIGLSTFADSSAEAFWEKCGFRVTRKVIFMYTEVINLLR